MSQMSILESMTEGVSRDDSPMVQTSSSNLSSAGPSVVSSPSSQLSRKRRIADDVPNKKAKLDTKTYCHQCRQPCDEKDIVRCSKLKPPLKNGTRRACHTAWCAKDLSRRYGLEASSIKSTSASLQGSHDPMASYHFTCPCCMDQCQASNCRKKKGLPPLGQLRTSMSKTTVPADSSTFTRPDDSDLSSLSSSSAADDKATTKKAQKPKTPTKPKTGKEKTKKEGIKKSKLKQTTIKQDTPKGKATPVKKKVEVTPNGKVKKGSKTDGKVSGKRSPATKKGEAKKGVTQTPKPKVKKPEVIPELPKFERIDTRISHEEAVLRIALREYLFRFRAALAIPERLLVPLDDFDRPLTEASVRLFGGAMLETLKDDVDEELSDTIFQNREELRYYADLARFNSIFNALEEPLGLRVLKVTDTDEPLRRASRLPQPSEVICMLLALAERTLSTPTIRLDFDSMVEENAARRRHLSAIKNEAKAWESKQKKLNEAKVTCRSAEESKANRQLYTKTLREHNMEVALHDVNLRATLCRRAFRQQCLGTDAEGNEYHVLSPRMVSDDMRPPIGWAGGLLVWTKDDPRWCHFGKSDPVKKLSRWVEWKAKKTTVARRSKKVEVVIPQRQLSRSSASSDLSSPPESLLNQLEDYQPTKDAIVEEGKELARKLREISEWLEVLEWKGMGEIA